MGKKADWILLTRLALGALIQGAVTMIGAMKVVDKANEQGRDLTSAERDALVNGTISRSDKLQDALDEADDAEAGANE